MHLDTNMQNMSNHHNQLLSHADIDITGVAQHTQTHNDEKTIIIRRHCIQLIFFTTTSKCVILILIYEKIQGNSKKKQKMNCTDSESAAS